MKINGKKLTKLAKAKGLSAEQLAEALGRADLSQARKVSAVNNWMMDRDHPRCKREDIADLANALGVAPREIAKFQCVYKYFRGSPRKAKLLVDLIRNKRVDVAENLLTFTTKRAALPVKKALLAAREEAMGAEVDLEKLYVAVSTVGDAPRIKRFQPKDRGRAHPILVRMAHITIALEERN